jgi:diacylglycerol O-acyltransferase
MRGPLPVYARDPVERLRIVRQAMKGVKESKQALGAEVISGLEDFAPPTLLAQASRLNFSTRLFNLIVTNVPGPQFPLYMMGREMQEIVPVAFLPENHALAIAAMSYNGKLDFGLLGDYDAVPDLEKMAGFFQESLDELLSAAGKSRRKRVRAAKTDGGPTKAEPARSKAKAKKAAAKPKPRAKTAAAAKPKPASRNGSSSNGRGAKRSAIRGKAQRPRLIDSD